MERRSRTELYACSSRRSTPGPTTSDVGILTMTGSMIEPEELSPPCWPLAGHRPSSDSGINWGWERDYFVGRRFCPCDPTQGHSCEICDGSRA